MKKKETKINFFQENHRKKQLNREKKLELLHLMRIVEYKTSCSQPHSFSAQNPYWY